MKLSPAIKKETIHIAVGTAILCAIMVGVFFLVGKFDLKVVYAALISGTAVVLNFFLMCVSKQKELDMEPVKGKNFSILSYNVRLLAMLGIIIACYFAFDFNIIALVLPVLFPRITILVMTLTIYRKKGDEQ